MSTTTPIATAPVQWSYSRLTSYETCPRRFFLTSVSKQVAEPQSPQMALGNRVHKAMENYVGGKAAMPPEFADYSGIGDRIRATPGNKLLEYKFGVTKDLRPTTFFGKDVWLRGIIDVGVVRSNEAVLLDYKTGNRKPDADQLRLFAMAGFSLWPHLPTIKTGFLWLKTGQTDRETFDRAEQPEIHREFAVRVHRMERSFADDDWPARPSGLCRKHCPVGRALCNHCGQ